MISKIIAVRPGRISGWCFDPASPGTPLSVDVLVNGEEVVVLPCNRLRRELDPAQFPNRVIGFAGQLPFEFWTGETVTVTLRLTQDGTVLDQRDVETPDMRIAGSADLFGELAGVTAGRLTGWAASRKGSVGLDLEIDGQPFGRADATAEMNGHGFAIWLPDDIYDGARHHLRLTARLADGSLARLAEIEQVFAPQDMRHLTGAVTGFAQGRLTGQIRVAGWPDEAVVLVAEANGAEVGRAVSDPAQEGSFVLVLQSAADLVPGQSRLEIYEEVSGLTPAFLEGDLLVRFLQPGLQSDAPEAAGRLNLSLAVPVRLSTGLPAWIDAETPEGLVSLPLHLALQPGGLQLTAQISMSELPAVTSALRLRLAGDVVLDLPLPQQAAAEPAAPAEPAGPAFEAEWSLLPGGIVQGWVWATATPDVPVAVALSLNHVEVMQGLADQPVLLSRAGGPRLPVACGFRFDLSQLSRNAGVAQVTIAAPGGIDLPGTGSRRQRFPVLFRAAGARPGMFYGLRSYPQVGPEAAALYGTPLETASADLLARIFGSSGKKPAPGLMLVDALVEGVLALAADPAVLQALARPGTAFDVKKWNPLTLPTATEIATALPLSAAGLAALPAVADWRGLLSLLIHDDLLFPAILSQDDWGQMAALHRLRRAAALERDAEPLLLPFGAEHAVAAPDLAAVSAMVAQIAVVDPHGDLVLLLPEPGGVDLAGALRARLRDPAAALQPGWRVLAVLADGTARNWPLLWQDQRREVPARVHDSIRLSAAALTPRHVSVTLTGQGLHRRVLLRLGAQKPVALHACEALAADALSDVSSDPAEAAEQSRRYAAVLPVWDMPAATTERHYKGASPDQTFDLRLGEEDGRRPQGVPLWLADMVQPAAVLRSEVTLVGGQMTGWAFDQAAGPGQLRLALIETVPPQAEQLERNPDALPADVILAEVTADQPSDAAERLHMVKNCGYGLVLPASVLDGQPHALRLVGWRCGATGADRTEVVLWQMPEFTAHDADLQQQIGGCATAADLHRFLLGLARVRRFAVLDLYFRDPRRLNHVEMTMEQTFEVLCAAMVQARPGPAHLELERLFAALWALARQDDGRSATLAVIAAKTAMAGSPLSPARFPHTPLIEAVMDLVCTTPLTKASAAVFGSLAAACSQGRRHQMALSFLQRGLAAHAQDSGLLTQLSGVQLALGDAGAAETAALAALNAKPRNPAALMALARCYARQGRPLHAASALTGGKGLSAWQNKPPSYDQSKNFAGMDWVGVMRQAAAASDHRLMQASIDRSEQVLGQADRPEISGLTLVLTGLTAAPPPELFSRLAPAGCLQLIVDAEDRVSEIECIGRWVVILSGAVATDPGLDASLLSQLFAQMRPHEAVAELLRGTVDDKGVPNGFSPLGAIIRSDALRAFGPVPLKTFLSRAAPALRVKTILM